MYVPRNHDLWIDQFLQVAQADGKILDGFVEQRNSPWQPIFNGGKNLMRRGAPAGGLALAAPIIDSWVTTSGDTLQLKGRNLMGLEIEIAAVLKSDLTANIARQGKAAVLATIDHFIVGIELIGTRIDKYNQAGPFGPLSDFMITAGYIKGEQCIATLPEVDGMPISIETPEEFPSWELPSILSGACSSPSWRMPWRPLIILAAARGHGDYNRLAQRSDSTSLAGKGDVTSR